jgi:GNAT superfamily N-acetyltransferase
VVETWREEGLAGLWFKALYGSGVYRWCFITYSRVDTKSPAATRVLVECATLAPEELDEYVTLRPDQEPAQISARLDDGHLCFVARHEGRIVAASWVCGTRAYLDFLGCELEFADDVYYHYDIFVLPEFRGQDVPNAVGALRLATVAHAGYTRSIGVVWRYNRAVMRGVRKLPLQVIGTVGVYRLGPWRRHFLRLDPAVTDMDNPPVRLATQR